MCRREFNSGQPSLPESPAERHYPRNQCPGVPLFSEDVDYYAAHSGMEYAPVLFPGFSWTNMHKNITSKKPPAPRFAYPEGGVFIIVPRMGKFLSRVVTLFSPL